MNEADRQDRAGLDRVLAESRRRYRQGAILLAVVGIVLFGLLVWWSSFRAVLKGMFVVVCVFAVVFAFVELSSISEREANRLKKIEERLDKLEGKK